MKILKRIFKYFFILSLLSFIFIIGLYVFCYFQEPISLNTKNSLYLYDINDNLVFQGSNNSEWVSLDKIDDKFINYIIQTEDQYFYKHKGFDLLRIIKTFFSNLKSGHIVAGASSISQQYVKNLYLDFNQTWKRKIKEAYLTINLETHYSKKEILEGYLNTIYFGNGIYGIQDASQYYFNKDASDLSMEQAIILTGIPKSPNNYNPVNNLEACLKRANIVAKLLLDRNVISNNDYSKLDFNGIKVYGKHNNNNLDTLMYYQDSVMEELRNINGITDNMINDGGLRVFTNLNIDVQSKLEESINKYTLDDDNQVASIVVDPSTGHVLALAGGKNYYKSQFNRVTHAKRQVGSTIKPFLYYAALNNGMTEASTFLSEKTSFVFAENKEYSPTNYSDSYGNKDITMAAALSYSDNVYAVKTHLFLGENVLVDTLRMCGLKERLTSNPSLALGASEISMIDFAGAYSTLASGGSKVKLSFINRVETSDGIVLYKSEDKLLPILEKSNVYILNEMMRNTYNYSFKDYNNPTVIYLNGKLSRKYAVKSGTTDFDYYFAGYNPDVLMLVWAGNDENREVPKTYSNIIKDIWLDTVEYYLKDVESNWYDLPEDVVAVPMDPISGHYNKKSKTLFYFIKGTEIPYIKKRK